MTLSRNPNFHETESNGKIILSTICPFCHKEQTMVLEGHEADAYKNGKIAYANGTLIQDAFPFFDADQREFILTGICPECWDSM